MNVNEIPFPYQFNTNAKKEGQTADASKYPQGYFKPKKCRMCSTIFTPKAPSEHYCCDKCKDEGICNAYLQRKYNVSLHDYRQLWLKQDGKCAICNTIGFKMNISKAGYNNVTLNLDHCHSTNKVRGLLCHNCNRALGLLQDNVQVLQNAIKYIQKEGPTTIPMRSTLEANASGSGEHPNMDDDIVYST
jgi:hypothetical protein